MKRKPIYSIIKRLFDLVASLISIIILAIPMLIIAIAIKLDSKGPVLFKQDRIGKNKKIFKILKFRSMFTDTDPNAPTHLLKNATSHITKVGKFIRNTSLDELPQIFNIFIGQMSFVGPRPALWNQDDLVAERDKYHANDVVPGVTGLAQISGRDELEIPVKAKRDGEYVSKRSLFFDFKILVKTVFYVFGRRGVVEGGTGELHRQEGDNMTKKMNIPFSPPDISDLEVEEVAKALKSGWITTGPRVKQLEKTLAKYVGVPDTVPNCVCLNSQTACGELSLRVLGIGPQEGGSELDEVITCAYTYTASASVVCHIGAKLVLIDCQKNSLEMDYDALEKAINEHTKAIIPIDLGGVPCDYDRIFEIVNKKKHLFKPSNDIQKALGRIAIVEDAAHAIGASYKGKMLGSIADFTNFSFHAVKNFTTGEGGAMTWNSIPGVDDAELYHQIQLYSLHGQSKDALNKNKPGMWEYDIVGTWYKCNMTDIMGAIGLKQFERYPGMLSRRKDIIARYDNAFKPLGMEVLPHYTSDYVSSGHLYITRISGVTDEQRREMIIKLAEEGVSCNVHYKPLPMHTAYKKLGFDIKNYPNSYEHYANEITLPLHTCLTDEEVDYIINKVTEVIKQYVD